MASRVAKSKPILDERLWHQYPQCSGPPQCGSRATLRCSRCQVHVYCVRLHPRGFIEFALNFMRETVCHLSGVALAPNTQMRSFKSVPLDPCRWPDMPAVARLDSEEMRTTTALTSWELARWIVGNYDALRELAKTARTACSTSEGIELTVTCVYLAANRTPPASDQSPFRLVCIQDTTRQEVEDRINLPERD